MESVTQAAARTAQSRRTEPQESRPGTVRGPPGFGQYARCSNDGIGPIRPAGTHSGGVCLLPLRIVRYYIRRREDITVVGTQPGRSPGSSPRRWHLSRGSLCLQIITESYPIRISSGSFSVGPEGSFLTTPPPSPGSSSSSSSFFSSCPALVQKKISRTALNENSNTCKRLQVARPAGHAGAGSTATTTSLGGRRDGIGRCSGPPPYCRPHAQA
eukprot:754264-Hanusia_phi.AAC.1